MARPAKPPREMALLDAVDALPRERFAGAVWRVTREGRDPVVVGPSNSRWCDATFDVLYTSLERDGALAEIHALLASQPVFPSVPRWLAHQLSVGLGQSLNLLDLAALGRLGVETARFRERRYERTQAIADAAYFLGFDGLIAPSARWNCQNCMIFADRVAPTDLALAPVAAEPIDWRAWEAWRQR